jgi:hypothetical protein
MAYQSGIILKPKPLFLKHDQIAIPHLLLLEQTVREPQNQIWYCLELDSGDMEFYSKGTLDYYYIPLEE